MATLLSSTDSSFGNMLERILNESDAGRILVGAFGEAQYYIDYLRTNTLLCTGDRVRDVWIFSPRKG